jgi:hypothetical protein
MEISMAKKKKVRKHRGWAGAFRPPLSKSKMDVGVMRRQDKAKAEEEFSDLVVLFGTIKAELKENLAKGRFDFRKSLKRMYKIIWDWDAEGFLDDNQVAIARLRGVALRSKTNRFSGIVAICSDKDRKTRSRWSQDLDEAFEAEVEPKRLISFLKKQASSKTEKSKAKKQNGKRRKTGWGRKPAK